MRKYNVKILFNGSKARSIEFGDFGEVDRKNEMKVDRFNQVDSVIAWPVNPNSTGAKGILRMLGIAYDDTISIIGQD